MADDAEPVSPYGPGPAAGADPPSPYGAPPEPAVPPQYAGPARRPGIAGWVIGASGIGAALVVILAVALVVVPISGGPRVVSSMPPASPASPAWSSFPGDGLLSDERLGDPASFEAVQPRLESFVADYRARTAAAFGLSWEPRDDVTPAPAVAPNGYGGDSMLVDSGTRLWSGTVAAGDPTLRQRLLDDLRAAIGGRGSISLLNQDLAGTETDADARQDFGGPTVETQPFWSITVQGALGPATFVDVTIYDPTAPPDPAFASASSYQRFPPGAAVVQVRASALDLLHDADRPDYLAALSRFDLAGRPTGAPGQADG